MISLGRERSHQYRSETHWLGRKTNVHIRPLRKRKNESRRAHKFLWSDRIMLLQIADLWWDEKRYLAIERRDILRDLICLNAGEIRKK